MFLLSWRSLVIVNPVECPNYLLQKYQKQQIPPRSPASSFLHFSPSYSLSVCPSVERAACGALRLAFSFTLESEHSGKQSPTPLSLHSTHNVVEEVGGWSLGYGGRGGWLGSARACQSEPVAPSSFFLTEMSSVTKTT